MPKRSEGLPNGSEGLSERSEGLSEGPEGLLDGSAGLPEESKGLPEWSEGQPEGLEDLSGEFQYPTEGWGAKDRCLDVWTDRISPHSKGPCPLFGSLPIR